MHPSSRNSWLLAAYALTIGICSTLSAGEMPPSSAKILSDYHQLPLRFEQNRGQTDSSIDFLARGTRYIMGIASDRVILWLQSAEPYPVTEAASVRIRLPGANADAESKPEELQSGTTNYFLGNDPARWHAGVKNYSRVRYQSIYKNIDLIYYGNHQQLEYDFVVTPGGDPNQVQLEISGAARTRISGNGDLVITTTAGDVIWKKPVAYQETAQGRRTVAAAYRTSRTGNGMIGLKLGNFDRRRTLIIDPTLAYEGTGGPVDTAAFGPWITVDSKGSAYIVGATRSPNYPTTSGAFHRRGPTPPTSKLPNGHAAIFVTKLAPNGYDYVYSTFISGTESTCTNPKNINGYILGSFSDAVAVDSAGNAYITGWTDDQNFPTSSSAYQRQLADPCAENAVVVKLNPQGSGLAYSTYLGGSMGDNAYAIAIDKAGNAYVAGDAGSPDFPTTSGAFQPSCVVASLSGFCYSGFIAKLNSLGSALIYSTYFGSPIKPDVTYITGLAIDSSGNSYITGPTFSPDLPVVNAAQPAYKGSEEGFVGKLNSTGSGLSYLTYLGGSSDDVLQAIAVDTSGSAYVTGYSASTDFPTKNGFQSQLGGSGGFNYNVIITKVSPDGKSWVYSTYLGGSLYSNGNSIALDSSDQAYVTGYDYAVDFPVTKDAYRNYHWGGNNFTANAIFSVLGASGSTLTYSTYYGLLNSTGYGVALDRAGNAYIAGAEFAPATCKSKYCFKPRTDVAFWAKFKMH